MNPQLEPTQQSEVAIVLMLYPCHREDIFGAYPNAIGFALTSIEANHGLDHARRLLLWKFWTQGMKYTQQFGARNVVTFVPQLEP